MDKITIVVCSQFDEFEKKDYISHVKETCGVECNFIFIGNNKSSLSEIYKNMVDESLTDIIIFMHDDLHFFTKNWGNKIIDIFKNNSEYSIIGLAGSADFDEKCAWWQNKELYGQVAHKQNGNVWITEFSDKFEGLNEVCVIDGIFMAIDKTKIKHNFDTTFTGFHHYDTSFCLSNFLDGCKLGVTTEINVLHDSVGFMPDEWYDNRCMLFEKLIDKFPIKVKK